MAILVTGGYGLIGVHTARLLAEGGAEVVCYDRAKKPAWVDSVLERFASNIVFVRGDVLSLKQIEDAVVANGVEGIIHAAGIVNERIAREDPLDAIEANILGTANALEVARRLALKRFVFTSSSTVYGRREDGAPITEDQVNPNGIYGETKYVAERLVERYRGLYSVDARIVRISSAYGPGKLWHAENTNSPIYRLAWDAVMKGEFKLPRGGRYRRDFTYVRDTALGICRAYETEHAPSRVYNISCGRSYTLAEVAAVVKRVLPCARLEIGDGDLDGHFALRDTLRGPLDISRARAELGFEPGYDLESGLREYIAFVQDCRASHRAA